MSGERKGNKIKEEIRKITLKLQSEKLTAKEYRALGTQRRQLYVQLERSGADNRRGRKSPTKERPRNRNWY